MTQNFRFISLVILTIIVTALSAWTARAPMSVDNAPAVVVSVPTTSGPKVAPKVDDKVQSRPVEFTGTVQALDGNKWRVNGMTVFVDVHVVAKTAVRVGDTLRFSGSMAPDGTFNAVSVAAPVILATKGIVPASGANNVIYFPRLNMQGSQNGNGDDQQITGVVGAINGDQITIDGVTYTLAPGVDTSSILVGDTIEIEFVANTDGSLTITDIQSSTNVGENSNDDNDEEFTNGNSNNSNDDENEDDNNDEGNNGGGDNNGSGGDD